MKNVKNIQNYCLFISQTSAVWDVLKCLHENRFIQELASHPHLHSRSYPYSVTNQEGFRPGSPRSVSHQQGHGRSGDRAQAKRDNKKKTNLPKIKTRINPVCDTRCVCVSLRIFRTGSRGVVASN